MQIKSLGKKQKMFFFKELLELLNSIPLRIYCIDENYNIVFTNNASSKLHPFLNVFNLSIEDIKNFFMFYNKKVVPKKNVQKCYQTIHNQDKVCSFCPLKSEIEINILRQKSYLEKIIHIDLENNEEQSSRIIFNQTKSKPQLFIEIVEDITEQTIEKEKEELRASKDQYKTLLSGMLHELNNPLTGLSLTLKSLIHNIDVFDKDKMLARLITIKKDVHRIGDIINEMSFTTKSERLKLERVKIQDTIMASYRNICRTSPDSAKNITWNFSGDSPKYKHDIAKMERVFVNLYHNSLQSFNKKTGYIKTEIRKGKKNIRILVEDNAGGIAPEEKKKVFQLFYTKTNNNTGTGLGLNICHNIIDAHEGRIRVRSRDNITRFYITLPLKLQRDAKK